MIRKASLEESKLIYTENMEKDFPDDEIPDYNRFVKLTEDNVHDVYLYSSNNQDVAYFITVENNNNILITHLAIMKEFRSKGLGKILLEEIKKFFKDKNILIVEVEAESRANNEEELDINNREYEPQEIKKIMEEIYANVGIDKSKLKIEILERKQ